MYIETFEGSWLRHPFWRSRFLLTRPEDLTRLLDSDVSGVIIDDDKGLGLPGEQAEGAKPASQPCELPPPIARKNCPSSSDRSSSYADERTRAVKVVNQSKKVMRNVFDGARLGKAVRSADVLSVVDDISASLGRNSMALINVARLKSKDEYTYLHSVAVCALMVNLARHIGIGEEQTRELGLAGLLHDIGKMTVPSPILNKPGHLSDEEFAIVQSHPEKGFQLLGESCDIPDVALDVCRHHHEKVDGTGYPHRLRGDEITLAARMGAICDVYDALTSNRAYKDAWAPADAIAAMDGWPGQFDPDLLFRFMQSIAVYPVGMLVRLRSNRLALVLDNGRRASRPRVRAFYSTSDRQLIKPVDVVIADSLADDQIISREDPAHWAIPDWTALRANLDVQPKQMAA